MAIAILGYGTVGSGTFQFLEANRGRVSRRAGRDVRVKWIFDMKSNIGGEAQPFLTNDIEKIMGDPEVTVVAECMGGLEPAFAYAKAALAKGKSVVTSNKELVAARGGGLIALAKENSVNFMFEASVGGGIPIILPMEHNLALDDVTKIKGILNGTTNYILTNMQTRGAGFSEVLKEAQELGYAEKDPSADVSGTDTCRKLAILLSLALGRQVDSADIPTEGIASVTKEDFALAASHGKTIKLMGAAKIDGGALSARVAPFMVDLGHPLAHINDVYNAVNVVGRLGGSLMFCGKGAGKFPTASAMAADIAMCAAHPGKHMGQGWSMEKYPVSPLEAEKIGGIHVC